MKLPTKGELAALAVRDCEVVFVHLALDLFVPSAANLREHWAKKHRRVKHERGTTLMWLRLHGKFPPWDGRVVVTLTRTGGKTLDSDNLRSAFKAVRDGVADWIGRDDGDERIEWRYGQKTGGKKGTVIEIGGIFETPNASNMVRAERVLPTPAGPDQSASPS